ncbi:hypothetical protein A2837_00340 [Candidatus Kaiserbacteria bacterium RIFCSPHIGHO2_01_FULL_46_22]|uniref:Bacterial sugar transferase domain-containing protein n=1 Tax=Candidatus Kaiserbacteria bacterium RIFCSPHIGHO2_01_FULL_46_22 TaxID=1798475 RepID=A0A1F6BXN0_9BACT|nr:MAG: hypothetical protein A2837_00340 [Candidatus Kaiserbacteria bacterium RIFCSPHIGHO2_01_FULL_46_22]
MGERTRELFILILGDAVCFTVALWLTLLVRYAEWPSSENLQSHLGPFLLLSALWITIFYIAGLYDKHTLFLKNLLLSRIISTQVINIVAAAILFIVIPFGIAPKTNLVIYLLVSIVLITVWRLFLFNYFSPKNKHKALLIADGSEAVELADEINNNDRYNYSFVRILDYNTVLSTEDFETKLLKVISEEDIKTIVADTRSQHLAEIMPLIFDLSFLRFEFVLLDFNKLYEDTFDHIPLSSLEYEWFVSYISPDSGFIYTFLKRTADILMALFLLIPCAIVFPVVIAAIKLSDRGVIFYTTKRLGQFNQPIDIIKFRTMTGTDNGATTLNTKLEVTRLGRLLRKTRIDELPQLINVLKGDLSFIGPRPELPARAKVYADAIPYYNTRHFIKPGLSGWAQINDYNAPRGEVDIDLTKNKLSYDLYYLKHRSLFLDMQIALKTIATLLMRTGS